MREKVGKGVGWEVGENYKARKEGRKMKENFCKGRIE